MSEYIESEVRYKNVYAILDEKYHITDITFEENEYILAEIPEDMSLEEYRQELDLENTNIIYAIDNADYDSANESQRVVTVEEMKEEIALVTAELMNTMLEMMGGGDIDEGD